MRRWKTNLRNRKQPYTEEEFQKKLKETGLTVDDLKSDIRRQLSIQKLLNREVVAKISITDEDVENFFQTESIAVQYRRALSITSRRSSSLHIPIRTFTIARTTKQRRNPKPPAR